MFRFRQFILTIAVCLFVVGCQDHDDVPESFTAELKVLVKIPDVASRAIEDGDTPEGDDAEAVNSSEKMHKLRFIIVRPDGTIEHNRLLNLDKPAERYGFVKFNVIGPEKKKVYLFVNESSRPGYKRGPNIQDGTKYDLSGDSEDSSLAPGKIFPEEDINNLILQLDQENQEYEWPYLSALPMNGIHEVEVADKLVRDTLTVTRAAVKFTYRITNKSSHDYTLKGLSINKVTFESFYMPHWVTEDNKEVTYLGDKVAEDFNAYKGDVNDNYFTYKQENLNIALPSGQTTELKPIYQLEGKYNTGEENPYSTSLTISSGNGSPITLEGKLDNLPNSLLRNTHVVVNIAINDVDVNWEVDVIPYSGVSLSPEFGLLNK